MQRIRERERNVLFNDVQRIHNKNPAFHLFLFLLECIIKVGPAGKDRHYKDLLYLIFL